MWDAPEVVELLKLADVNRVDFDQCMYDLKPSDGDDENARIKKPTTFMMNIPYSEKLALYCDKSHHHVHAFLVQLRLKVNMLNGPAWLLYILWRYTSESQSSWQRRSNSA